MKLLRRLLTLLLAIVALATVALYVADPVVATRMLAMPFGGSLGPVVPVRGSAGAGVPVAAPDARTIDAGALEAAIAYGAETGSHALLVWQGDALQLEHYYPGSGADTRTPTQSMHKSVVALLYGTAIRDGFIGGVDDAVGNYLPEWRDDSRGKVTLRQLLQQASGIGYPRTDYLNPAGDFLQIMMGGNLAQKLLAQPAEQLPDTQFDYHNVNVGILGIVLERATGRPYAEYLSNTLWQPIGADDATVTLDSEIHRTPRTYCCLDATARSWLRLGLLHLNDGAWNGVQVLPREWLAEVVTPSRHNPGYGYLTWLGTRYQRERRYNHKSPVAAFQSEPFAAPDVRFFDGFGGQRVYIVPSHRLVIVRTGALAMDWDDARLPNLLIRGIKEPLVPSG